jgi:hypothetical protein
LAKEYKKKIKIKGTRASQFVFLAVKMLLDVAQIDFVINHLLVGANSQCSPP